MLTPSDRCGQLLKIFTAPPVLPGAPPAGGWGKVQACQEVESAEAVVGKGLVGDRWFGVDHYRTRTGKKVPFPGPRQISLIASEEILALAEQGVVLDAPSFRRNLLVQGVPLCDLVGQSVRIGDVIIGDLELCQPCRHLVNLVSQPALVHLMRNKAGVRGRIVTGGVIAKGDRCCW